MIQYKPYTKKQLEFISDNRTLIRTELAAAFNKKFGVKRTADAMKRICFRNGWLTGRTGRFEKGHIPWDTGTKGILKANKTSFKTGNRPANWKPVGSERICSKDGYILIKTAEPRTWRHKHVVVWEAEHGKVPIGRVVIFKDGDKLNIDPDNLMLISRAVLLNLNQNGYKETPEVLKPSVLAVANLECKVLALAKN